MCAVFFFALRIETEYEMVNKVQNHTITATKSKQSSLIKAQ